MSIEPPTAAPADLAARVRQLEEALRRQAVLREVMEALAAEPDLDTLFQLVLARITDAMQADRASLFLIDVARGDLWTRITEGDQIREIRLPLGQGIAGHVAATGDTVNIPDAYEDPRFNPSFDRASGYRTRTILCMPLVGRDGARLGAVQVLNKAAGVFTPDDEALLAALGTQVAIAIRNAALLDAQRRETERRALLLDVMRSLSSELELDALLDAIMARTTEAMRADRSTLFLVDAQRRELWSKVAQGMERAEIRFPIHVGIAGHVATTGETLNIPDAYDEPRFNKDVDRLSGYRTRTILCMPLRNTSGAVIGVMQCLNKRDGVFTAEDEELLGALCSQAAIALENARLFEEVVAMKNYNESILRSMATGVLTLDGDGRVTTINPAALRILGLTEDRELIGSHYADILLTRDNPELAAAVTSVLATGKPQDAYDRPITTHTGQTVKLNLKSIALHDAHEKQLGMVLVIEDITEKQRALSALSRLVSHQVADRVMSQDILQLGGSRNKVTVLMSDIRDFTAFSENTDAEEVVAMLNSYFTLMTEAIFDEGGAVDKFIGDAIMAIFGWPEAHDDAAMRAVRAAIEIRRRLHTFNEMRRAQGKPPIENGIGLCNGEVVSGGIGSETRLDLTVIGDTVNVAARLEGLSKQFACKILMNEAVYLEVRDHVPCVFLGAEQVKGRAEAVRVYGIPETFVERRRAGRRSAGTPITDRLAT
ncbi:MAG TPA: GAF domain-containing protein [Chloroflexota bacterium]|nr:GAF domain-containing protein [Chloroflexota bacterium]